MQNTDEKPRVEHDLTLEHPSDESRAEQSPVVRSLANPRRVRRA